MLNYFEHIDFGEKFIGAVSDLIQDKKFINWILIKSQDFCFDHYTFKKIEDNKLISEKAREFQVKKINKYTQDCLLYNENYKGIGEFTMYAGNLKIIKNFEKLEVGKFKDMTIIELAEINPRYLEFCINNFHSFIVQKSVFRLIEGFNPEYIILNKTKDTLEMKYAILATYEFLLPRFQVENRLALKFMRNHRR